MSEGGEICPLFLLPIIYTHRYINAQKIVGKIVGYSDIYIICLWVYYKIKTAGGHTMKAYKASGKLKGSTRWDYLGKWKGDYVISDFERFFDNAKQYKEMRVKDAETGEIVFERTREEEQV